MTDEVSHVRICILSIKAKGRSDDVTALNQRPFFCRTIPDGCIPCCTAVLVNRYRDRRVVRVANFPSNIRGLYAAPVCKRSGRRVTKLSEIAESRQPPRVLHNGDRESLSGAPNNRIPLILQLQALRSGGAENASRQTEEPICGCEIGGSCRRECEGTQYEHEGSGLRAGGVDTEGGTNGHGVIGSRLGCGRNCARGPEDPSGH